VTAVDLSNLTAAFTDRLIHINRSLPVPELPRSDDDIELIGVS
jgi:hypothetical protein